MGDVRLSSLTKKIRRHAKLIDKKSKLQADLTITNESIIESLKEITEILDYHGIRGMLRDIGENK